MSQFLENEFAEPQASGAASDPLASKYGEIGIAAVVAALRLMGAPAPSERRRNWEEDRTDLAASQRKDGYAP